MKRIGHSIQIFTCKPFVWPCDQFLFSSNQHFLIPQQIFLADRPKFGDKSLPLGTIFGESKHHILKSLGTLKCATKTAWKQNNHFHFFKQGPSFKITLAVFSYPPTLLPDWLSNTRWPRNKPWNYRMKAKFTHVLSAISSLRWPNTSGRICFSMMERSPTIATSAATQAPVQLMWKNTCWFTVVKSRLFARSAIIPAQSLVTSRHTC